MSTDTKTVGVKATIKFSNDGTMPYLNSIDYGESSKPFGEMVDFVPESEMSEMKKDLEWALRYINEQGESCMIAWPTIDHIKKKWGLK